MATSISNFRSKPALNSTPPRLSNPFGKEPDLPSVEAESLDISFEIPQVHRLRFTQDCFGVDADVLLNVMQPGHGNQARVQVWVDDGLADADSRFTQRITEVLADCHHVALVGDVNCLPGGEAVKNDPLIVDRMLESFNRYNLDRRSYVLVVGGGAVLDTVGYAAAIAHRGIRLVRVPTTTLAQADSGVGVKNAVNWFNKKNWKGTFATPWAVINDARLLEGLSDRDFRCGFSEAVKVSLLKDLQFFNYLSLNAEAIASRDAGVANTAIRQSVLLHLYHITRGGDPFELLQARPLDFGHWSAHKAEAITNYQLRHGEAVSIGVAVDVAYSTLKLGLPSVVLDQTLELFDNLQLPIWHDALDEEAIFDGLEEFRQHLGGELTITMLQHIGHPIDVHEIDQTAMRDAMQLVCNHQKE